MDKRVLWLCVLVGSTVGSLLPVAWGGSELGLASLLLGAAGGIVGVVVAAGLSESL
jgi:hypothetical protein